ncbi:condensation domain-containing protein [Bradyrhizobium sp. USDA 3364]
MAGPAGSAPPSTCRASSTALALTKSILGWVDRHEALRSRLVKDGSAIRRATIDPGAAALEKTVVGDRADPDEIAQLLEELFDAETKPLSWPAYVFVTITRPTSTSLLLACDHSVSDAYSIALVPYEIHELYTAAILGVAPELAPVSSYLDHAESERERLGDLTDDHPAIAHWRELIAAAVNCRIFRYHSVRRRGPYNAQDECGCSMRYKHLSSIAAAGPRAETRRRDYSPAWRSPERHWQTNKNSLPLPPFTRGTICSRCAR